jgi:hypothetical protein
MGTKSGWWGETALAKLPLLKYWPAMARQVLEVLNELERLATYPKTPELEILRS